MGTSSPATATFQSPPQEETDFFCPENWVEVGTSPLASPSCTDPELGVTPPCTDDIIELPSWGLLVDLWHPASISGLKVGGKTISLTGANERPPAGVVADGNSFLSPDACATVATQIIPECPHATFLPKEACKLAYCGASCKKCKEQQQKQSNNKASKIENAHSNMCNECHASPCKNQGLCKDGIKDFTCTCNEGWAGKNCTYFCGTECTEPPTPTPTEAPTASPTAGPSTSPTNTPTSAPSTSPT